MKYATIITAIILNLAAMLAIACSVQEQLTEPHPGDLKVVKVTPHRITCVNSANDTLHITIRCDSLPIRPGDYLILDEPYRWESIYK